MKNLVNNTFNTVRTRWENFRSLPQRDQNYHWAIAITVYYLNLQHFAWDSSAMDLFPYTLSVAHILTYIYHSFIILAIPPFLIIVGTCCAVIGAIDFTRDGYYTSLDVWRLLAEKTVVALHKFSLKFSDSFLERWKNDMESYYLRRVLQKVEERFNLDGYFIDQDSAIARDRHPTWWIKNDVDWFDERNPRLIRLMETKKSLVEFNRAQILKGMEARFLDPEVDARIEKLRKSSWLRHLAKLEEEKKTKSAEEFALNKIRKELDARYEITRKEIEASDRKSVV